MNPPDPTDQTAGADPAEDLPTDKVDIVGAGLTLDGRYSITRELGRGGIGVVYLARDQKLQDSPVVVKVLRSTLPQEQKEWFEKKFRSEIAALLRIDHPGVVRAQDIGQLSDGRSYLVMQYVDGVNLRSTIVPGGMEITRAANLIRQMGQALNSAHEQGVIHRDLKPENIMLQRRGEEEYVKLIDFGIATVKESPGASDTNTTIAGTTSYMAPEQLRGKPTVGSDVYALGVIAYEMLTGSLPFHCESPFQMLEVQRAGVRVLPRELRPELPLPAQSIILRALSFDEADRPASARDFAEELVLGFAASSPYETQPTSEKLPKDKYDSHSNSTEFLDAAGGESLEHSSNPNLKSDLPAPSIASRSRLLWFGVAVLIVVIATFAIAKWPWFGNDTIVSQPLQADYVPQRELGYWFTALRNPKRNPGDVPFDFTGEGTVFRAGDQIRLNMVSPGSGFLYVINESLPQRRGRSRFIVLYPDMEVNDGSAIVEAGREIRIPKPSTKPDDDWWTFDEESGIEKTWFVYSEQSVPLLESVKVWSNRKDRGLIGNAMQTQEIAQYFAQQSLDSDVNVKVATDDGRNRTVLKARGKVIIHHVKLEHQ